MSPSLEPLQAGESAYELKFPLDRSILSDVREWARDHLEADPNGAGEFGDTYDITSLYLDTARFDVFHQIGSFGRNKLRIRRYGDAQNLFLERKLKRDGMVRKWRTSIAEADLSKLAVVAGLDVAWEGQWFHRRMALRSLQPVCQVRYRRTARVASTALGTIRLTIDEHLTALPQKKLHLETGGMPQLSSAPLILELKYRREMPLVFKQLIERFRLEQRPASKYRMAVAELRLNSKEQVVMAVSRAPENILCPAI